MGYSYQMKLCSTARLNLMIPKRKPIYCVVFIFAYLFSLGGLADSANNSTNVDTSKAYTIKYKVTSQMWDAEQLKPVATSFEVLERIHRAFILWQEASAGALQFKFDGFGQPSYDGMHQLPYDGGIHIVLNGRYNFHGEVANSTYRGTIPDNYKKGVIFVSKKPSGLSPGVITHEIGHALGLPHAASNASVMFSGQWAWGLKELESLPVQDTVDLQYLWKREAKEVFSISGEVITDYRHQIATVFAVNVLNGTAYSTRSDHKGNFTVVVGNPGKYKLVAKAIEASGDIPDIKKQRFIPQSAGWYVENGRSSPDPKRAFGIQLFKSRPHVTGVRLRMFDTPAPFRLTKAWSASDDLSMPFLSPGDEISLALPEVIQPVSLESFGRKPDYEFLPVESNFRGKYQFRLRIADHAQEGERLVIVHDLEGRKHIGLIGIHISRQASKLPLTRGPALVVHLPFDEDLNDAGPYLLKGQVFGDEVLRRKGTKGRALFVGGTEDWLDVPLDKRIALDRGFTAEIWFQREDWANPYFGGSGFQSLVAITSNLSLDITTTSCATMEPWRLVSSVSHYNKVAEESEVARAYTPPDTVLPNVWTHAATVYDPFEASLTLYVDGEQADKAWGVPKPRFNMHRIRFGTWYKANQAFRGYLDDFKLYNYARSPQEIRDSAILKKGATKRQYRIQPGRYTEK